MLSKNSVKRPILLLEVLIALMIVALCILPLLSPHLGMIKFHKSLSQTAELDHFVNLLHLELLEKLHKNEIPWDQIQKGSVIPLPNEWMEKIKTPLVKLRGFLQFKEVKSKKNKEKKISAHLFQLSYSFQLPSQNTPIVFHYLVPIFKQPLNNEGKVKKSGERKEVVNEKGH